VDRNHFTAPPLRPGDGNHHDERDQDQRRRDQQDAARMPEAFSERRWASRCAQPWQAQWIAWSRGAERRMVNRSPARSCRRREWLPSRGGRPASSAASG
jgi:hypothetical protein